MRTRRPLALVFHRFRGLVAAIAVVLFAASAAADEPELDAFTGLQKAGDWELVRNNCVACHSARLITQQRGSKEQWLAMIRWMQKSQNLWQFDPDTEARIVGYLAEYYPPREQSRRASLPPDLMPPNPYDPKQATK